MKFCVDCKHYEIVGSQHRCARNIWSAPDPVLGGTMINGTYLICRDERGNDGVLNCGPEAKCWEAQDA